MSWQLQYIHMPGCLDASACQHCQVGPSPLHSSTWPLPAGHPLATAGLNLACTHATVSPPWRPRLPLSMNIILESSNDIHVSGQSFYQSGPSLLCTSNRSKILKAISGQIEGPASLEVQTGSILGCTKKMAVWTLESLCPKMLKCRIQTRQQLLMCGWAWSCRKHRSSIW